MKPRKFTIYHSLFVIFLLSYWAIAPLLRPGFFPIHDDTQVVRVQQMAQALREGQFPVRWVADLGYGFGYPIYNFYAPLAYYVGAFFNLIGFDALLATKLMMILGILLSGVFMYLLAREFWGEIGGILSGLFYIYAPYHAIDVYVRGAVAEFWAMAFLPLVFWAIYRIFKPSSIQTIKHKWILVGGLGYAGVILSHNLTAMMVVPFLAICFVIGLISLKKEERRLFIIHNSLFIILSLTLSAFYWLPALSEMKLTKIFGQIGGGADWRDHFVFLDQLWASPWGFGGSSPGRLDGMSFMIGKLHLIFAAFSIFTSFFFWKKSKTQSLIILFTICCLLLAVFFTNQVSQFIWELIPTLAFIQYPWRFLVFASLATSFVAGATMLWFKKSPRLSFLGGAVIILVLLFLNIKYFQPQFYLDVSATDYIGGENIKWKTSKISDEYLPKDFPVPTSKDEVAWEKMAVLKGEAEIENLVLKSHRYIFEVIAKTNTEILLNTAYFPGWKVWVNGKKVDFTLDNGKIKLSLPAGNHQILARFTNTPIRTIANFISMVSWIGLIWLVLIPKERAFF